MAKQFAYCPGCDTRIRFSKRPTIGHRVRCPECLESLEIVALRPLEVDWAYDDAMAGVSNNSSGYSDDHYDAYEWEDDWQ